MPGGKNHRQLFWNLAITPHEYLKYTLEFPKQKLKLKNKKKRNIRQLFEDVSFERWNLIHKSFKIASSHDNHIFYIPFQLTGNIYAHLSAGQIILFPFYK